MERNKMLNDDVFMYRWSVPMTDRCLVMLQVVSIELYRMTSVMRAAVSTTVSRPMAPTRHWVPALRHLVLVLPPIHHSVSTLPVTWPNNPTSLIGCIWRNNALVICRMTWLTSAPRKSSRHLYFSQCLYSVFLVLLKYCFFFCFCDSQSHTKVLYAITYDLFTYIGKFVVRCFSLISSLKAVSQWWTSDVEAGDQDETDTLNLPDRDVGLTSRNETETRHCYFSTRDRGVKAHVVMIAVQEKKEKEEYLYSAFIQRPN